MKGLALSSAPVVHLMPHLLNDACKYVWLHLCWVAPSAPPVHFDATLFGFGDFIVALALLVIVYTTTDIRYRFRVAVALIPLRRVTFWMICGIGLATLLTGIWLREGWPVLSESVIDQSVWEAILGFLFLGLSLTWMFFAFIRPQIFGRLNYYAYSRAIFWGVLKGADDELPTIADELGRSADALIEHSRQDMPQYPDAAAAQANNAGDNTQLMTTFTMQDAAHDILLMIGNRKFCRAIAASSPYTAIAIFNAAGARKRGGIPLGQFAVNLSTEAIFNKDSILYHEDEGFESGYFGYVKPFSEAVYGDWELVESLANQYKSPLDIRYDAYWAWDSLNFLSTAG